MLIRKFLGRDCELSTTGIDADRRSIAPWQVTQRVLAHVDAAFSPFGTRCWSLQADERGGGAHSSDCLRRWAPNGQCYYSDMAHVEVCTGESLSPHTFAAQCWSTLRVAEAARSAAQAEAAPATRYLLSAANVDASDPSVSWGTHLNVAVSADLFHDLVIDPRRPGVLGFVTSALAAAIPFFGCGYLLPLRDGSVRFSLSGRAHHITRILCDATTQPFARGLLNSRREAHALGAERLHLIGFDFSLVAAPLLAAFVQACLAAAEAGFDGLELCAPLDALHAWSLGLDPDTGRVDAAAELQDGRMLSLGTYVAEVAGQLRRALSDTTIAAAVGDGTAELLQRVEELAARSAHGDLDGCAPHLDWAAKLRVLRAHCAGAGGRLGSPATRLLDHDFASTDPARGALWRLWQHGLVEPLVSPAEVDACLRDGPREGRAWARGRLVQRWFAALAEVAWDQVELRLTLSRLGRRLRLHLPDPGGHGEAAFAPILHRTDDVEALARLVDAGDLDGEIFQPMQDLRAEVWLPTRSGPTYGDYRYS